MNSREEKFKEIIFDCINSSSVELGRVGMTDVVVYCPQADDRKMFLSRDRVIISGAACFTVADAFVRVVKERMFASDVDISIFGTCEGAPVIEMKYENFIIDDSDSDVFRNYRILGPDIGSDGFLIRQIGISNCEEDFIVNRVFPEEGGGLQEAINLCIGSIATGCGYSSELVSSVEEILRESMDGAIVATTIELCGYLRFPKMPTLVERFLDDRRVEVRKACYFSLGQVMDDYLFWLLKKRLDDELDLPARRMLTRIVNGYGNQKK